MMVTPGTSDGGRAGTSLLSTENLCRRFGGVVAVDNVSMEVGRGEIVGLIGPNGAGKTTILNLVSGLDKPDSGTIRLDQTPITGLPAHRICKLGVARTFQNIRLLGQMSVLDNVKIAFHHRFRYTLLEAMFRLPRFFSEEREVAEKSMHFLALFGLADVARERADSLPYGRRRKLEIARAVATGGALLLLDEPAAGMNPNETAELMVMIRRIHSEFGVSILLIEHDMKVVMAICDRVVVVDCGRVIAAADPQTIRSDPKVIEAYLGVRREGPE